MAFTAYHNIVGSTAQDNELLALGDIARQKISCLHISNIHDTAAATVDLYIFKDSTDAEASKTYYFFKNYQIPFRGYLTIESNDLLNFDNTTDTGYSLYISVGATDIVDVMIKKI
jgi:hypothetical protein